MRMAFVAAASILAVTLCTHSSGAQQASYQRGGEFNDCVSDFYDPGMYNWFSYRNDCSETLSITFCAMDVHYCGAMRLGPGRHATTSDTQAEHRAKGGYRKYICRDGFLPVNTNDDPINSGKITRYRCKRM